MVKRMLATMIAHLACVLCACISIKTILVVVAVSEDALSVYADVTISALFVDRARGTIVVDTGLGETEL